MSDPLTNAMIAAGRAETAIGELVADCIYLRKRGFAVERAGSEVRVGKKLLSFDQLRALAARERELDNGVEAMPADSSSLATLGRCPLIADGGVKGIATGAHDPSVGEDPSASLRAGRLHLPTRAARREEGGEQVERHARRSPSPRADRDLSTEIVGLVVAGLDDDVDDIGERLISEAVQCVHAAGCLIAVLPHAKSRAAVIRELKRFLPEIVEQRAGELHRGGGARLSEVLTLEILGAA